MNGPGPAGRAGSRADYGLLVQPRGAITWAAENPAGTDVNGARLVLSRSTGSCHGTSEGPGRYGWARAGPGATVRVTQPAQGRAVRVTQPAALSLALACCL